MPSPSPSFAVFGLVTLMRGLAGNLIMVQLLEMGWWVLVCIAMILKFTKQILLTSTILTHNSKSIIDGKCII